MANEGTRSAGKVKRDRPGTFCARLRDCSCSGEQVVARRRQAHFKGSKRRDGLRQVKKGVARMTICVVLVALLSGASSCGLLASARLLPSLCAARLEQSSSRMDHLSLLVIRRRTARRRRCWPADPTWGAIARDATGFVATQFEFQSSILNLACCCYSRSVVIERPDVYTIKFTG